MSKTETLTTRCSNSLEADLPSAPPETHQEARLPCGQEPKKQASST